jgi:putative molybdopterin biosynthesis protein
MHRVHLTYTLRGHEDAQRDLHHPLMALLAAVHDTGSISAAARRLSLSYRHVWGELKRWELELGQALVLWAKGQPAALSPFGEKLLWAERRAQARLAPKVEALRSELELGQALVLWAKGQPAALSPFGEKLLWAERRAQARLAPKVEALRSELEQAFAIAFDDSIGVLPIAASHDDALPLLRQLAQQRHKLHLDIGFCGSLDALAALNAGRCLLAGFHALTDAPPRSPTARAWCSTNCWPHSTSTRPGSRR